MDSRNDAAREGKCQMATKLTVWRILNRISQTPRRSG